MFAFFRATVLLGEAEFGIGAHLHLNSAIYCLYKATYKTNTMEL